MNKNPEFSSKFMATTKPTKKDLENKIAELEKKLANISSQIQATTPPPKPAETKPAETKPAETKPAETKPAETKPAEPKPAPPPKPQPAATSPRGSLPKGTGSKPAPPPKPQPAATSPRGSLPKGTGSKPAEQTPKPAEKAAPPTTVSAAMENAWQNYPMSSFHEYRAKVTGYSPAPNRYFGRRVGLVGKVKTSDWNLQKIKVTGYTQPSNLYFATRARMAYHPHDKSFTSYGLEVEGVEAQAQAQQAPPPPPPKPSANRGTLPKGF